jgi:chaperonin GroES
MASGACDRTGRARPDRQNRPLDVKAGDQVLFGKWAGTDLIEDRLILKESDILGVVESHARKARAA